MGDMSLTVVVGLTQVILGIMGIYLSLRSPKKRHHHYWIGSFIAFGLVGVALTVLMAKHSSDSQASSEKELKAAEAQATQANIAATEANKAATQAERETARARAEALQTAFTLEKLIEKTALIQQRELETQVARLSRPLGSIKLNVKISANVPQKDAEDDRSRRLLALLDWVENRGMTQIWPRPIPKKKSWISRMTVVGAIPKNLQINDLYFHFIRDVKMFRRVPKGGCSALFRNRAHSDLEFTKPFSLDESEAVVLEETPNAVSSHETIPLEIKETNGAVTSVNDVQQSAVVIESEPLDVFHIESFEIALAPGVEVVLKGTGSEVFVTYDPSRAGVNSYCYTFPAVLNH